MKVDVEKLRKLEWIDKVLELPEFQKFWGNLEVDAATLRDNALMTGSEPTAAQSNLLALCGLEPPTTTEDKMNCFIAFRAVAHYITKKQHLLQANRDVYREGVRQLNEQGAQETEPQVNLKSQ